MNHSSHLSRTFSWHTSNCILHGNVQILASFLPLLHCSESYISCLYTVSHIPRLSIFNTANGTYMQPYEELLFSEGSWSTPRESTCIQERCQSALSIECLPSNEWLQHVGVTRQRSALGPEDNFDLFPDRSKYPIHVVSRRLLPGADINPQDFGRVVPWSSFCFTVPATFTPTEYHSVHRIMSWSICRLWSFCSASTCRFQICDRTNICWITLK